MCVSRENEVVKSVSRTAHLYLKVFLVSGFLNLSNRSISHGLIANTRLVPNLSDNISCSFSLCKASNETASFFILLCISALDDFVSIPEINSLISPGDVKLQLKNSDSIF